LKQTHYKTRTKWNSHNTVNYPQYNFTLIYMALLYQNMSQWFN